MTPKPRLSEHIAAQATPLEMEEQWAAIQARLSRRDWRSRLIPLSLVLVGASAVVLYPSIHRGSATHWTSLDEPVPAVLADGSQLRLQPHSDVNLLGRLPDRLQVVRGGARFQVRRNPERRFQVIAADIEVTVIGTTFTVELDSGQGTPRVSVEQGEVEVRRLHQTDILASLHAGESWPAPAVPAATRTESMPPSTSPMPEPEFATAVPTSARASSRERIPHDPRRLLEQANAARRSGDVAQAAALLETLGERYPRDARAALASFELGRLRMDALADLPGALAALKKSIALAPHGLFREDADACLATVYARLRDRPRCESARRAYLDRYPAGMHAAEMSALDCGRSP